MPFVRLGRSRAARFFKVLLSPRAAGYGCLGPQSSPPAGVRYHAPTSAAARVARPVMHQLIHPDSFKPHYEQSRVVASLSVATGLYHFVSMALPSRVLSFAPSIMGLNCCGGLVVLRLRSLATRAMLGAAAEARAGAGADFAARGGAIVGAEAGGGSAVGAGGSGAGSAAVNGGGAGASHCHLQQQPCKGQGEARATL